MSRKDEDWFCMHPPPKKSPRKFRTIGEENKLDPTTTGASHILDESEALQGDDPPVPERKVTYESKEEWEGK